MSSVLKLYQVLVLCLSPSWWPLQGEEETPLCVGCSRITLITAGFGSNLKGGQVLLCSCWKPGYLFIMLERSLHYRKEMVPSAEFCFLCRFIWIPCDFPQAPPDFSLSQCQVSSLHSFLRSDTCGTFLPSSPSPDSLKPLNSCLMPILKTYI